MFIFEICANFLNFSRYGAVRAARRQLRKTLVTKESRDNTRKRRRTRKVESSQDQAPENYEGIENTSQLNRSTERFDDTIQSTLEEEKRDQDLNDSLSEWEYSDFEAYEPEFNLDSDNEHDSSELTETHADEASSNEYDDIEDSYAYRFVYKLSLVNFLIFFLTNFTIPKKAGDVLIKYLRNRERSFRNGEFLPATVRTLLKTPRKSEAITVEPGSYAHFGFIKKLECWAAQVKDMDKIHKRLSGRLKLIFNWDGGETSRSSKSTIWPIQMMIDGLDMRPFLIGVYVGRSKPNDFDEFLKPLVDELEPFICQNVRVNLGGCSFRVRILRIILDNPAKASTLKIKAAHSKRGCSRCHIEAKTVRTKQGNNEAN